MNTESRAARDDRLSRGRLLQVPVEPGIEGTHSFAGLGKNGFVHVGRSLQLLSRPETLRRFLIEEPPKLVAVLRCFS